jgi:hypothetical protein
VRAERASELAGDDAHVFHADDTRRDETPLRVRWAWFALHSDSLFLLQRVCHGRSPEASHYREIWLLGFDGAYGLHSFIRGQTASLINDVDQCSCFCFLGFSNKLKGINNVWILWVLDFLSLAVKLNSM